MLFASTSMGDENPSSTSPSLDRAVAPLVIIPGDGAVVGSRSIGEAYGRYLTHPEAKAFVYTRRGGWFFAIGQISAGKAIAKAMSQCEPAIKRDDRAPCRLGDVDGVIVDPDFQELSKGEITFNVNVEYRRSDAPKTRMFSGKLFWKGYSRQEEMLGTLFDEAGEVICRHVRYAGNWTRMLAVCDADSYTGEVRWLLPIDRGPNRGVRGFEADLKSSGGDLSILFAQ